MLSKESLAAATEALATLKNLVEQTGNLSLVDKIKLGATYKAITKALEEGTLAPTATAETEQVQPVAQYEDTGEVIAIDKLSRKEQTEKITQALEFIARGRSILSNFIRHEDKTVLSINSPSGYNQPIVNTMNRETESLKMVFSTASNPYFVTYSPKTKFMSVSVSRYWKTVEAFEKEKAVTK